MPPLSNAELQDFLDNPYEHKSDTFYFVDSVLVMHNKAEYSYITPDEEGEEEGENA